ncbi:hypothetical protein CesoFtcFv8_013486 [Champsocephalus esox]|uniref:Uncharacterized protein n=1 Tax=Champsocephalus esox TaxID=159716 RepID=A0AAN8GSL3_9TELE|nr:hypothetical protein CesoFtcFv8_013486 [Champsocephalus esox]
MRFANQPCAHTARDFTLREREGGPSPHIFIALSLWVPQDRQGLTDGGEEIGGGEEITSTEGRGVEQTRDEVMRRREGIKKVEEDTRG